MPATTKVRGTYSASVWDHEVQCWEQRYSGVSKWGLRQVIRELRGEGWSEVSALIEEEYEVELSAAPVE